MGMYIYIFWICVYKYSGYVCIYILLICVYIAWICVHIFWIYMFWICICIYTHTDSYLSHRYIPVSFLGTSHSNIFCVIHVNFHLMSKLRENKVEKNAWNLEFLNLMKHQSDLSFFSNLNIYFVLQFLWVRNVGAAYLGGSGPVSHIWLPSRCQLGLQDSLSRWLIL